MPFKRVHYGDQGETSLLYGGRVSKADPRVEAYGSTDEAVSALGMARALCQDAWVKEVLLEVQRALFTVGGELATDVPSYPQFTRHFRPITPEHTARLDALIAQLDSQLTLPNAFIIPGGSPGSAALDMARAVLRRAERRIVDLHRQGLLANPEVLRFVNRASDLLFLLARWEDRALPPEVVTGQRV
ncbi:MAG: cob(I)yrinic acid a,c-diamide adenosyltransferase [Dehalococcoidia bacterium]|nr:cob(I)yrinic acid a,c-diamide adenosyltransferase [Dehalococcoidia bacterium]MDW8120067.1 cob(I)yrinic acid a,c-diamide adenosyltransferase [Chloroflexota bacterium]